MITYCCMCGSTNITPIEHTIQDLYKGVDAVLCNDCGECTLNT